MIATVTTTLTPSNPPRSNLAITHPLATNPPVTTPYPEKSPALQTQAGKDAGQNSHDCTIQHYETIPNPEGRASLGLINNRDGQSRLGANNEPKRLVEYVIYTPRAISRRKAPRRKDSGVLAGTTRLGKMTQRKDGTSQQRSNTPTPQARPLQTPCRDVP